MYKIGATKTWSLNITIEEGSTSLKVRFTMPLSEPPNPSQSFNAIEKESTSESPKTSSFDQRNVSRDFSSSFSTTAGKNPNDESDASLLATSSAPFVWDGEALLTVSNLRYGPDQVEYIYEPNDGTYLPNYT